MGRERCRSFNGAIWKPERKRTSTEEAVSSGNPRVGIGKDGPLSFEGPCGARPGVSAEGGETRGGGRSTFKVTSSRGRRLMGSLSSGIALPRGTQGTEAGGGGPPSCLETALGGW